MRLLTTVLVAVALMSPPPSHAGQDIGGAAAEVALAALTHGAPSTVLTFEGGLVGALPLFQATQFQLGGKLCEAPSRCQSVYYLALPGQAFNDWGATEVNKAVSAVPDPATPIVLYGHSQGGQVIYSALRGWAAKPSTAPDPARLSWVSIGNPENAVGGRVATALPANTPYQGTEVIRQYDGWADWPTDPTNLLAVANALIGMTTVHSFYFGVDLKDPNNIRYTPDQVDGTPGSITYVFVPNDTLPLVQITGLLAPLLNPILDPVLRPMVEAGYNRPFGVIPGGAGSAAAVRSSTSPQRKPARMHGAAGVVPAARNVGSKRIAKATERPAHRRR